MKKILLFVLVLAMTVSAFVSVSAAKPTEVSVYVNSQPLVTDQPAIIYNNRTMVPFRAICEALRCEVDWDSRTKTATIKNKAVIIKVSIDSPNMTKAGIHTPDKTEVIKLDTPPIIYNNRTLVPARAISEALDAKVLWDGGVNRVSITLGYDFTDFPSEGMSRVRSGDKFGFINENGDLTVPLIYESAENFSEGMARVKRDGKWGFVNKEGKEVIPAAYEEAKSFKNGMAQVKLNGKYHYINKEGIEVE